MSQIHRRFTDVQGPVPRILSGAARSHRSTRSVGDWQVSLLCPEVRQVSDAVVSSQLTALTKTYETKIAQITKILHRVANPKIRRMKKSELENRKADYKMRRAKLQARRVVTVTFSIKLAGIVHFE